LLLLPLLSGCFHFASSSEIEGKSSSEVGSLSSRTPQRLQVRTLYQGSPSTWLFGQQSGVTQKASG
jgi:hypothetical protein